jgi:hypothetical protein
MIILNKIKNTKLIINIVVLSLIYFFSFYIFPKLGFYNKLDYVNIKTNAQKVFILTGSIGFDNESFFNNTTEDKISIAQNKFFKNYFDYLIKNKNLISDATCPKVLMVNDLRNIQIYYDYDSNFIHNSHMFNVRFNFYKSFGSSDKIDINKCFEYIFKENLNKYFLLYRDKYIEDTNLKISLLKKLNNSNDEKIAIIIKTSEDTLKLLKTFSFYIDPNVSYTPVQKKANETSKFLAFIICFLIVIFINVMHSALYKKKISKFIKKFINS